MYKIVTNNLPFFILFFLFLLIGLVIFVNIQQGEAILFFSEHRSDFGDLFFTYFTKIGEPVLYLFWGAVLFLMGKKREALFVPITGFVVLLLSLVLKLLFQQARPRTFFEYPAHFQHNFSLDQINFVDGINLLVGQNSYPSGHTMSAFALYGFLAFVFWQNKFLNVLFFFTALLIGISRIYLVQHFLRDVILGGAIGVYMAMLIYYIFSEFYLSKRIA